MKTQNQPRAAGEAAHTPATSRKWEQLAEESLSDAAYWKGQHAQLTAENAALREGLEELFRSHPAQSLPDYDRTRVYYKPALDRARALLSGQPAQPSADKEATQ